MTEINWSIKTADSIIERTPKLYEDKGYHGKWSYDYGVVLKGFEAIWRATKDPKYLQFIQDNMDYFIQADGSIRGYEVGEYNIDHINNGKLLFTLYRETGQEKYRLAADLLRSQLKEHPRTSEGAFWHKEIYPYQIWLDGLYMGAPFYGEYDLTFNEGKDLEDVIKQFILCDRHTRDPETGLLFHAWDETKSQPWCDPETGLSENFWGRSLGWYVMALVDMLEILPENHSGHAILSAFLVDTLVALRPYQDVTGVWYQVVNQGQRKGNYLEASASSMITCGMAKGIRLGVLDQSDWQPTLEKAYQGLIEEFILLTKEGWVNLNKNCQVAGLGGADQRDGTYTYYISEPIIVNDQKGVGAFLQATAEYERLITQQKAGK
ncbi:glycoside hydrolase family 88 protein [Vagococcus sp. BWB3-3]|uniref:Glycoside hydrolase family 88 protein n=1 Tax=Vagococcus allomyrinae TaxID=2794353 RepID=A0A940SU62_9ENTE|nr:glycoside hydrolase family 88 protein [Vagococcus allomyrinae]MBP1043947.1 glycoside hydrolase family 88 protein [Vagococcus allomyrinae]